MKLFLASVAATALPKLASTFSLVPEQTTVAFIPTAGDPYPNPTFVDSDRQTLEDLGYKVKIVDLKGQTEDSLREAVSDCQAILVAGGNTFYLLQEARKSGFDVVARECVDRGVVYIGSSAGSVLVGPDIEAVSSLDDRGEAPELKSSVGLQLIDSVILPHSGVPKYADTYQKILDEYGRKYKIIPLTDAQVAVVNEDELQIITIE